MNCVHLLNISSQIVNTHHNMATVQVKTFIRSD